MGISIEIGMRDRCRYLHWVLEAKKRFGLCVLDYVITSNHVHLLIKDTGPNVIANSMQLIAGTHGASGGGTAPIICNAKLKYGHMLVTFLATL